MIPLLPFTVKGKKQPVRAFAVGAVERQHRARRDHLPLAGREDELAAMRDDLDAVRDGAGRVLELVGDHGTGKSRLAEVFLYAAGDMESTTVVCERYEATTPYATFWMLGRWLLGLGVDDPPETVGRRLQEYVDRHVPTLAPLVSLLGTVLDLDIPDPPALSAFEPEFRRRAVADTAARFVLDRPRTTRWRWSSRTRTSWTRHPKRSWPSSPTAWPSTRAPCASPGGRPVKGSSPRTPRTPAGCRSDR